MSEAQGQRRFSPAEGDQLPSWRRLISQAVIAAYAEASGDHNPVHLDPEYARRAGLPGTIAHGLLTLGTACAAVESWAGESAFVARVSCRFSAPVRSGEELVCSGRVATVSETIATVDLSAITGGGERALSRARAELRKL
ncbi:MAG: MaoC/PaaZ C-terminal domain-containing protein [Candidatus Dormibacteria bacterium]